MPGAVGVATANRQTRLDRRGAFAGGIGGFLFWAVGLIASDARVDHAAIIFMITFMLLLPLANGLWDWLSWRISRWLGRDLLKKLDGRRRAWTITWHAVVDAAAAVLLLATLAFALAFGVESYNHFALLLASPLVMLVFASPKQAELATALESNDTAEHQDAIVNDVGWHLARTQYLAWTGAILLTILLLVLLGGFVGLIHQGGLADYVADIAVFAIDEARWVF